MNRVNGMLSNDCYATKTKRVGQDSVNTYTISEAGKEDVKFDTLTEAADYTKMDAKNLESHLRRKEIYISKDKTITITRRKN